MYALSTLEQQENNTGTVQQEHQRKSLPKLHNKSEQ